MTLNGISSYSSSLYGTTLSPAVSGFQQVASGTSSGNSKSAATGGIGLQRPQRMDDSAQKAALAKLQETDPALAQKMEEFHQKVDDMRQSGASQDDIQTAMKSNMDSLSDTEKSELKSVFGNPPSGGPSGPSGPGGPGGPGGPHGSKGPSDDDVNQVISSLKDTNSDLATKLQSFQDEIDQLEKSGASDDDVMAKRKEQMDSLSDTEKSQVKDAFNALRQQDSDDSVSSTSATASNSIYQQAIAAYAKSHGGFSLQLSQQGLAFAA